jgi:peptidyl-prolyl cis-trans isomerase SDCCAG10
MANLTVYANQPATRGKVVLHTTAGPLDVELWSKEAPLACRNFVQLCMEGYYDGVIFHRVIKDFMAQTGDPTGTGTGGESVYGGNFKDEFNQRLRFTHRGLLGMASSGPNTNNSQFFVTLSNCEWLEGKHTIFGKVTGNSLYNLPRFNELEVDAKDRPLYPPQIKRTEILLDPFDDIVPREKAAPAPEPAKKPKKKEKKNLSLLSFGEEAAAEEQELGAPEIGGSNPGPAGLGA